MLLWPEVKFSTWPSEVKKYMFRCVLKRETRLCQKCFAKGICEKWYILKSLSFLLWPDLKGSRWLNEVNLGTITFRTSQGFVWSLSHSSISIRGKMARGLTTPTPMCVLGWRNSIWDEGYPLPCGGGAYVTTLSGFLCITKKTLAWLVAHKFWTCWIFDPRSLQVMSPGKLKETVHLHNMWFYLR